jgi:dihydrolipoamide dehydrogenase
MDEGVALAERLAGEHTAVDYKLIPGVVYTHPEAASIGPTEEQLKSDETPYKVGKFPFMASGRARAMDQIDGFVKVLANPDSGRILGVHIVGPSASELISEAVTVMSFDGSVEDIALTMHAHPTLSEAFKEAALGALGKAVHA